MEKVRLGDIATVITKGTTPTTLGYDFVDDGVNFVKIESITEDGVFLTDKFAHITTECDKKLGRSQLMNRSLSSRQVKKQKTFYQDSRNGVLVFFHAASSKLR